MTTNATAPDRSAGDHHGQPAALLTIPEAARRLAIGRSTAYLLIAEGELEVIHIGRAVRVPADAVDSFVARRRAQGETGARLQYGRPQRRAGKRM